MGTNDCYKPLDFILLNMKTKNQVQMNLKLTQFNAWEW